MRPAGLRAHDRRSHQTFTCRRQTAGMRVLVVEDEPRMAQLIKGSLTRSGVAADVADSGEEALWRAQSVDYDGIVLDVMLPGMSGFAACRALREHGLWSPVLMLTARESVEDRVAGLDSGADDYLVKPFARYERLAVALLRQGRLAASLGATPGLERVRLSLLAFALHPVSLLSGCGGALARSFGLFVAPLGLVLEFLRAPLGFLSLGAQALDQA